MILEQDKKKLKKSLTLFIIALVLFLIGVTFMVVLVVDTAKGAGNKFPMPLVVICSLCIPAYLILMGCSALYNVSYRKNCFVAGKLSTTLYVFQYIFLLPFLILVIVMAIYSGAGFGGGSKLKKVTLTDKNTGKKYELTQLSEGGIEFKDQYGDVWVTYDGGNTFECVSRKEVVGADGKEYILRKNYDGTTDSTDQYGDTWQTFDGDTYERKPKVTDLEGRECVLTRYSAFSNSYTDQYGRSWETNDFGKTFEINWRWSQDDK